MIETLSVTAGKGGVGKTTLACNLAQSLAQAGKKVLLFDGDLGMANAELLFGIRPDFSIADVLTGRRHISDVLVECSEGVWLLSAGVGLAQLSQLDSFQRRYMIDALGQTGLPLTHMIVDTAPGLHENVLSLNAAVHHRVVVITPEPTSFSDAYALIKVLNQKKKSRRFQVVVNEVDNEESAKRLYSRFSDVLDQFLNVDVQYLGYLRRDAMVSHAIQMRKPFVQMMPDSRASQDINQITDQVLRWHSPRALSSGLTPFWQGLVQAAVC